jgi:hypothetical protein
VAVERSWDTARAPDTLTLPASTGRRVGPLADARTRPKVWQLPVRTRIPTTHTHQNTRTFHLLRPGSRNAAAAAGEELEGMAVRAALDAIGLAQVRHSS